MKPIKHAEKALATVAGGLFQMVYNTPFGQVLRGMPDAAA